jgi:hypothetical protein
LITIPEIIAGIVLVVMALCIMATLFVGYLEWRKARTRRKAGERTNIRKLKMVHFMCSGCGELIRSGPTDYNQGRQPLCMGCVEYLSAFQRPADRPRHRR